MEFTCRRSRRVGRGDGGPNRPSAGGDITRSCPHMPTIRRNLAISRLALVIVVPRRGRRLGVPALLGVRARVRLIDRLPFGIPTLVDRLSPSTDRKPGQQHSKNPFHCAPLRCWAQIYLQIGQPKDLWSAPCRYFPDRSRGCAGTSRHAIRGGSRPRCQRRQAQLARRAQPPMMMAFFTSDALQYLTEHLQSDASR